MMSITDPGRRAFLAGSLATAAAGVLAAAAPAAAQERSCCPMWVAAAAAPAVPLSDVVAGNKVAMSLAQASSSAMRANDGVLALAAAIPNARIRQATLDLLNNPAPTYQLKSPTAADREFVRQTLLSDGLIPDATDVDGIFPPVADPHEAPQAFWSAPGSTYAGHHSFPGGLATHEWVNGTLAQHFVETYDTIYGLVSDSSGLDVSIAMAAPLWHDIGKVTVMQWQSDGSELVERAIADTGGHHPISGAEAIVRGLPPEFVVALLSAHDAPTTVMSNPNETGLHRLVNYIRAASTIAHVDPVQAGLLKRSDDGTFTLAKVPPQVEGMINHLSDHDFVFSGDSAAMLIKTLQNLAPGYGIDPGDAPRFNLFRNTVFAQLPDMRLYGYLRTGGEPAVKAVIDSYVDLSPLA
jgi:hypothetical protein